MQESPKTFIWSRDNIFIICCTCSAKTARLKVLSYARNRSTLKELISFVENEEPTIIEHEGLSVRLSAFHGDHFYRTLGQKLSVLYIGDFYEPKVEIKKPFKMKDIL